MTPSPDLPLAIQAAHQWRDRCLIEDGSIFSSSALWTPQNAAYLREYFVENPYLGDQAFLDKLEQQLADAPSEVKQVAAEILWALYLPVSEKAMKGGTKRNQIRQVWEWSGSPLPDSEYLQEPLESGLLSPGTGYNTRRWREFRFVCVVMERVKSLPEGERKDLLADSWRFAEWLDEGEQSVGSLFRHILLYFLFPDTFQRVASLSGKQSITQAFLPEEYSRKDSLVELDRKLLVVREALTPEFGEGFNFYDAEVQGRWRSGKNGPGPKPPPPVPDDNKAGRWYRDRFGEKRVWLLAAGAGGRFWSEFERDQIVTIGWDDLGDLLAYRSSAEVREAHKALWKKENPFHDTSTCWEFAQGMEPGELVVAKSGRGKMLGIGRITSDYKHLSERASHPHVREVEWLATGPWELPDAPFPVKTLTDLSGNPALVHRLMEVAGLLDSDFTSPPPPPPEDAYTVEDALQGLFMGPDELNRILDDWARKKNLILQGPPGVGKTFIARRLAWSLMGRKDPSRLLMVQFHQSLSYDDFVQGWRPREGGGFGLKPGVFYQFCRRASESRDIHVLIIDEINRGNLSKIFGELMMLLEHDKRGADFAIPLTYSVDENDTFHVPENLFVLGMMNTADRSLALVDYALRRRFAFFPLRAMFREERFSDELIGQGVDEGLVRRIQERMTDLNRSIAEDRDLGPGFEIGHSFFCPPSDHDALDLTLDEGWYRAVVNNEIRPLLAEYWFDDPERVKAEVGRLLA